MIELYYWNPERCVIDQSYRFIGILVHGNDCTACIFKLLKFASDNSFLEAYSILHETFRERFIELQEYS